MSAIFSIDVTQEAQYLDLLGIAAGYGSVSVPITNLFEGDLVDMIALSIQGTGLTTIAMAIDQVQRSQGYYEWTSQSSVSGHFTLTPEQTAAISAATNCTYSVQIQVTRSENEYTREIQTGNISVRPTPPSPPLIVTDVAITGGPVVGNIGTETQLVAVAYDSNGNVVPGALVVWSSSDEDVATVDEDGLVTITGFGGANITVATYGVSALTLASGTPTPFGVGSLIYAETLSQLSFLNIGTASQYLRVNAGATAPEWDTITAADIGAGTFQSGNFTFGGNVLFGTDNAFDIGASGVSRARDLFLARNIVVGGTTTLNGLTYTWPGSQSANKVLKTDGAGSLSWSTPTEEIALADLTDVAITGASAGQVLRYSGSEWVNSFDASLLTGLNATQLTSGTVPNGRLTGAYTGVTGLGTLASDLLFTDATYDIGKTGATRPRDIFASRNATIGGTIAVTGAATLGVVGAGATTVTTLHASGASSLDGDVTLGGNVIFSSALARIIPGATSLSLRNTANGADNILIADSGAVTFRSTVGGITTLTATTLTGTLSTAAQPNITSIGTLAANLLFVDATYDVGQSGASRPRHGYFSGNITAGSTFIGSLQRTLTFGGHLSGSSFNNSSDVTLATDATDANTVSTIVARDSSGNFIAGTITASLTGHASLDLPLTGGTMTGNLLFVDATYDIGANGATRPRSGYFSTNVTVGGSFIGVLQNTLTFGTHLQAGGASYNNSAAVTITTDAVAINTAGTIVARDGSGNFAAGTITATLSGAAPAGSLSGSTLAAGVTASSLTSFGTLAADLLFVDATYDIGKTGATRPRDVFASRNVTVGGTLTVGTAIGAAYGGTGLSSYTAGDLVYASGATTIAKLAIGTAAQYLRTNAGATAPEWHTFVTADITDIASAATGITKVGALNTGSIAAGFGAARFGGNVIANVDATYDIGATGATRFRDLFLSRNFTLGGDIAMADSKAILWTTAPSSSKVAKIDAFDNGAGTACFEILLNNERVIFADDTGGRALGDTGKAIFTFGIPGANATALWVTTDGGFVKQMKMDADLAGKRFLYVDT